MIAGKQVLVAKEGPRCRSLSAEEVRMLRNEVSELAALPAAEFVARLDVKVATERLRSMLLAGERVARQSDDAKAAVGRYEAYCKAWDNGGHADGVPSIGLARRLAPEIEVFEVAGSIKWFDASKGYGFILPDNGLADILLHVTCLRAGGFQTALEGARVRCEVLRRPKGMQAFRILAMDESTAIHPSLLPLRTEMHVQPESNWQRATVKWFNRVRGFGYLSCGDGKADIFVHMETLRRFGFTELRPGQSVQVRWGHGSKGLMAAELRPDPPLANSWRAH